MKLHFSKFTFQKLKTTCPFCGNEVARLCLSITGGRKAAPLAPSAPCLPGGQEEEQPVSSEARKKRALIPGGQEEELLTSSETGKKRTLRLPGE